MTPDIWEGAGPKENVECRSGVAFLAGLSLAAIAGLIGLRAIEKRQAEKDALNAEADDRGWLMMEGFGAPTEGLGRGGIARLRQAREQDVAREVEFLKSRGIDAGRSLQGKLLLELASNMRQKKENKGDLTQYPVVELEPRTSPSMDTLQSFTPRQQQDFERARAQRAFGTDHASLEAFFRQRRSK